MNTEVNCTLATLDKAIRALDKFQKRLETKARESAEKVADIGTQTAQDGFSNAVYDGTNDVDVVTVKGDYNTFYVTAKGDAVAFIEFGTGTTYIVPAPYETDIPGLVGRGEFGHHLGKLNSWYYVGEPGTNGEIIRDGKHAGMVETEGNPANMCLYYAAKEMKKQASDIVKGVFK